MGIDVQQLQPFLDAHLAHVQLLAELQLQLQLQLLELELDVELGLDREQLHLEHELVELAIERAPSNGHA